MFNYWQEIIITFTSANILKKRFYSDHRLIYSVLSEIDQFLKSVINDMADYTPGLRKGILISSRTIHIIKIVTVSAELNSDKSTNLLITVYCIFVEIDLLH